MAGAARRRLLLHQFRDALIYIPLIAAAVTSGFEEFVDSRIILAVVVLDAVSDRSSPLGVAIGRSCE